MPVGKLHILASLIFATLFFSLANAQLTVTVSSQRAVMDAGQNSMVTANVAGGNGAYTCLWTWHPLNRPSQISSFGGQSCVTTFFGNGSDLASPDVIVANANDVLGDTGSGSVNIAVKTALSISITASANAIYAGNGISISNDTTNSTFGVPSGSPAYTFSYIIPANVIENGNGFTFPNAGTYRIIEVVEDSNGAFANASVTITALPVPVPVFVSISTPSSLLELGQSEQVSAAPTAGVPPYTFSWFVNSVQVASGSSNTLAFIPDSAGTYSIYSEVFDSAGDTSNSQALTINVIGGPSVSLHATPSLISAGQSVKLGNTTIGGMAPYTYAYAFSSQAGVVQNGNNIVTFNTPGNYIVTLTAQDSLGGKASSNALVTVTPVLAVTLSANTNQINAGQSVGFTNSTTGGTGSEQYSYSVSPNNGFNENGNSFTFNAPGNYIVTLTVNDISGEVASSNSPITVFSKNSTKCGGDGHVSNEDSYGQSYQGHGDESSHQGYRQGYGSGYNSWGDTNHDGQMGDHGDSNGSCTDHEHGDDDSGHGDDNGMNYGQSNQQYR